MVSTPLFLGGASTEMIKVGDNFFYNGSIGGIGTELTVVSSSNGSLIHIDINSGLGNSDPNSFIEYNNELYFWADDVIHGSELWISDGTSPGTHLVKDINPGLPGSNPNERSSPVIYNGLLYFIADSSSKTYLWKSDGTAAGTVAVTDPNVVIPYNHFYYFGNKKMMYVIGDKLFFAGQNNVNGIELWQTDGTSNGTIMLNETCPGSCYSFPGWGGYEGNFYYDGVNVYFAANDSVHGLEPWIMGGNVGISNVSSGENNFSVFPNPASDVITIKSSTSNQNLKLYLLDLYGRKALMTDCLKQQDIKLNRGNLPAGIYSVMLMDDLGKIVFSGKVIFQ